MHWFRILFLKTLPLALSDKKEERRKD